MRPDERDAAYLWDMREAAIAIESFIEAKTLEDFSQERLVQDAVLRQLIVLGEAASRVTLEMRERSEAIPWRKVIGLRNVIVHRYDHIIPSQIWLIVTRELPALRRELDALIPPLPDEDV